MQFRATSQQANPVSFGWTAGALLAIVTWVGFPASASAQCLSGADLSISVAGPDVAVSSTGEPLPHDLQQTSALLLGAWLPLGSFPTGTFDAIDPAPPDLHRAYRAPCGLVLSQNAVGYVKRSVATGELQLLGVQLLGPDGGAGTLDELIGAQPGVGSAVYVWKRATDRYVPAIRTSAGWAPNLTLQLGDVLWIDPAPDEGGESAYEVSLVGDVPGAGNGHTSVVLSDITQDFIAYAYPVAVEWTELEMADGLPDGSTVYWWDSANQSFSSMSKDPILGWPALLPLEPGDGVFVLSAGGDAVCCNGKPYDWP